MENNSGNFIHQNIIVHKRHIGIIDNHPPLIHIINIKTNQLIIMVPLQVEYIQHQKNMYPNLQNIQHINVIYKADILLILLLEVMTGRGMIQDIIHSTII